MGDSEDEYDRGRSRDKFRRERSDYSSGEKGRRDSRSDSYRDRRPTWRDDRRRGRDEYEEDRRRYSSGSGYGRGPGRDWSPPTKRLRKEGWDSLRDYSGPGMMTPYGMRPPHWVMQPTGPLPPLMPGMPRDSANSVHQGPLRHVMLSFKQFLSEQDDDIDETDAISSYNEYKCEFKRKQMEEFFEKHKDEDWFISLYHPTKLAAAKEDSNSHLSSRVESFLFLLENGQLDSVSLSQTHTEEVIKVMDVAVIKMEGGTDQDLLSLEEDKRGEDVEQRNKEESSSQPSFMAEPSEEDLKLAEKAKQYGLMKKMKRKKKDSEDGYSFKEEEDASDTSSLDNNNDLTKEAEDSDIKELPPPGMERDDTPTTDELAAIASQEEEQTGKDNMDNSNNSPPSRSLHLTRSVYIRHISPKISSEDIVEVCKTIPGFLRIAFAEPAPDKNYERRGWVTYTHETDIKDVCIKLSNMKVKDSLLACSVNRDLTRRVKHAAPAAWARQAVHSDLQLTVKLIRFLDEKHQLWEYAPGGDKGTNPVLAINEALHLEEEEEKPVSMVVGGEDEDGAIDESTDTDVLEETDEKLKMLEKLLWYLRLVHSLDYYNAALFPCEDNMPHRCGIFTIRSKIPLSITKDDLSKYCEEMESKVLPLLEKKKELSDSEIEKFGKKDPEAEAERFVDLNTHKLSENKYLCPLSGKKFKGPEFVRKHIFNKHLEKVEEMKKEAIFFNNYLRDPGRPMPLEESIKSSVLPPNPKTPSSEDTPTMGMISPMGVAPAPPVVGAGWRPDPQMMHMFNRGEGGYGGMGRMDSFHQNMGDRGMRSRGGRRGRGRRHVSYHDLDAPEPTDIY